MSHAPADPPAAAAPLRVVVADDHPIWRDAVERDLAAAGLQVVGVAGDGEKAVRVCAATSPDVLVCDLQMPGLTGVEVTRAVAGTTKVLVLSASGEQADVLEAVKAGATGYLVKSASAAELVDAVRRTAAGDAVFTPGLAGPGAGGVPPHGRRRRAPKLTARETEVLRPGGEGADRQAGRRAPGAVPPHGREPRAEHALEAAAAQPGAARPLRHGEGDRD
jgi:DNA-binding NarL/FixJ family response regulator